MGGSFVFQNFLNSHISILFYFIFKTKIPKILKIKVFNVFLFSKQNLKTITSYLLHEMNNINVSLAITMIKEKNFFYSLSYIYGTFIHFCFKNKNKNSAHKNQYFSKLDRSSNRKNY